jgi:hypothetical protein
LIPTTLVSTSIANHSIFTHHLGVWPPLLSVVVFFASFPRRAAQYGSCFPMDRLLGRFFARSIMVTRVPMTGPSTVMSEKMPAVC